MTVRFFLSIVMVLRSENKLLFSNEHLRSPQFPTGHIKERIEFGNQHMHLKNVLQTIRSL